VDEASRAEVSGTITRSARVRFASDASGQIEIVGPEGSHTHTLKPLADLYGDGVGAASVEPTNEHYQPMFMAIEQAIARHAQSHPSLTDAAVALTLERMGMSPDADPAHDDLMQRVQLEVRLLLSLSDYSRQELRAAIRKIGKSASRHTRTSGPRGYLSFIREYVVS
jgi:hypothetical protein